jgi:hypothetical protein
MLPKFQTLFHEVSEKFYKKELNPRFWKNSQFNPRIKTKLLLLVEDFWKDIDVNANIDDIQLTGSNANYTWNKCSDLDVHILVDFESVNPDKDVVQKMFDGMRFKWNTNHDVFFGEHDVEIYVQDTHEPHISSGIFSLQNNKWVIKPSYDPPEIDEEIIYKKYRLYLGEIEYIKEKYDECDLEEDYKNINRRAKKIWKKIREARKTGLQEDGEFSENNLVFKRLRKNKITDLLVDIIHHSYSNSFSES